MTTRSNPTPNSNAAHIAPSQSTDPDAPKYQSGRGCLVMLLIAIALLGVMVLLMYIFNNHPAAATP